MTPFLAEVIGTLILVLLGDGVVANVVLGKTKGNNGGWIVITAGWAFAVTIAVYCTSAISGAHLNPAVTVAMASLGKFDWALVPGYIAAQMIGAILGAVLVWLSYLPHWKETTDPSAKLGTFATIPAISNLICEAIGTAMLVLGILTIITPENLVPDTGFDKAFSPALVGLIVWSIGLSLGGPTGYAINPARDLGPRIAHALLPIPGKGSSDWGYAWIPVVGPIAGGVIGALLYRMLWNAAVV
jgi:glycerol uptake facilitator protein